MKAITMSDLQNVTVNSPIFKLIENEFNEWYNHNSKNNRDIKLVYFGSLEQSAMASVKGAILQAIEYIEMYMYDEGKESASWSEIQKYSDFESAFQI